jgi:hypothetical protein
MREPSGKAAKRFLSYHCYRHSALPFSSFGKEKSAETGKRRSGLQSGQANPLVSRQKERLDKRGHRDLSGSPAGGGADDERSLHSAVSRLSGFFKSHRYKILLPPFFSRSDRGKAQKPETATLCFISAGKLTH